MQGDTPEFRKLFFFKSWWVSGNTVFTVAVKERKKNYIFTTYAYWLIPQLKQLLTGYNYNS